MRQALRPLIRVLGAAALGLLAGCATGLEGARYLPNEGVAASPAPFFVDDSTFQFAVMGDRTGQARPGVFEASLDAVNSLRPEFVLSVGDQIEGYAGAKAGLDAEWDEFEALIADRLDMKFFYVAGNHDVFDAASTAAWAERRGRSYYSFVYENVLFLVLNTEDPFVTLPPEIQARAQALKEAFNADPAATQERILQAVAGRPEPLKLPGSVAISDTQIAWAENTLAAHADVDWTFVILHKPAWRYDSPAFAEIEARLAGRDYTVIAGHEHYFEHEVREGHDHITMATSGGIWLKDGPGRIDHMLWVTMTPDGPVISSIEVDGVLPLAPEG